MPVFVLANDSAGEGLSQGLRLLEFTNLDEADGYIASELVTVEGVGERTPKMYRIIVGEEILPLKAERS